jgi:ferric-dicitrate binding protein FerR (iron transport regulator)
LAEEVMVETTVREDTEVLNRLDEEALFREARRQRRRRWAIRAAFFLVLIAIGAVVGWLRSALGTRGRSTARTPPARFPTGR